MGSGGPLAHLHRPQHVSEHRALLAFVHLGAVLVAVGGERAQLVTQDLAVLKLKLLGGEEREASQRQQTGATETHRLLHPLYNLFTCTIFEKVSIFFVPIV